MRDPLLAANASPAGSIAIVQVLKAARLLLTGGLIAFGVWAAAPTLLGQLHLAIPTAAPTAVPVLPSALASTVAAVQTALDRAQQGGAPVPLTVTVSEQDLTRTAAPYFPKTFAGVTVSSPNVRVTTGQIVLTATAQSFFASGPVVATATPYASGGKLLVRIDSATLGGGAVPEVIRTQLTEQLQAAIDAALASHLRVTSVTATQGTLTLTGTALP